MSALGGSAAVTAACVYSLLGSGPVLHIGAGKFWICDRTDKTLAAVGGHRGPPNVSKLILGVGGGGGLKVRVDRKEATEELTTISPMRAIGSVGFSPKDFPTSC